MSAYPPPTQNIPIFNVKEYSYASSSLTIATADIRYLQSANPIANKTLISPTIKTGIISGYAPIAFTSSWEAYGDSITGGNGLGANQIWTYVLNKYLGKTCINNAVSGYFTHDNCTRIYNTRSLSSDNTTIIFIGTNDIRKQVESFVTQSPDRILDQCLNCVMTAVLYCAIPITNKINVRTGTTLTGTWTNTGVYPIGVGTSVINSTMTAIVSGRYIVVACTGANSSNLALYTGEKFNISIDNFVVDGAGTISNYIANGLSVGYDMVAGPLANWGQRSFIYDTGINGSHNVLITYTGSPGTDKLYIDYIGSWNSGGNNVLINSILPWNYRLDYINDNAALYSSDTRRITYNGLLLNMCHMLRTSYGLPVYYVDLASNTSGGIQADSLHPNYAGQRMIANRVYSVIQNGEYKYVAE